MNIKALVGERIWEHIWEPARRRLHRVRQLRIERDYWQRKCEEAEARQAVAEGTRLLEHTEQP
jgi:hypothetical protein